jgi:cytochrome b6-f complex iron-sulfur subunit
MQLDRRRLLIRGWEIGAALLALAAGWTSWDLLRPLNSAGATGKLNLGNPSDYAPGTATFVNAGRLWVANADGHLFALSQKCPHLGCRVPFCESSGRFECPCHGSVFDIGGEWISGPSPRGLDQHPLTLENGELVVDLSQRINGPDHGADTYFTPPKGPPCAGGV